MKLFKVETRSECPYILGDYCNHPDGPCICKGDDFPEDCPGENTEGVNDDN